MDDESEVIARKPVCDELCRLCANTDKQLIPIFQGEGVEHNLSDQIKKYLPIIKVTEIDKLPLQVCYQCTSTLIAWHNFFEQCRVADSRLREILPSSEKFNQDDDPYHDYTDDFRDDSESQSPVIEKKDEASVTVSIIDSSQRMETNDIVSSIKSKEDDKSESETLCENRKYVNFYDDIEEYDCLVDEFIGPAVQSTLGQHPRKREDDDDEMNADEVSPSNVLVKLEICSVCGRAFSSAHDLVRHECEPDSPSPPPPPLLSTYACVMCGDTFAQKRELGQHIRDEHDDGRSTVRLSSGKFQCPLCGKQFCRKLNATQHYMTHVSEKRVGCEQCEYRCYTKAQLEVHKTKHSKRFCCDICSKMFAYKFQLETHVQGVHYNMRPFACNICDKTFKTRYNYGSHLAQHRDVRNFQCPYCPHRCRKSYDLRVHVRRHTGEKPFRCTHCERCYSQNGDRLKHERHCRLKKAADQVLAERFPDNEVADSAAVVSLS